VLVDLQRQHVEEERLIIASAGGCTNPGQLTLRASRRRLVASKKASGRRAICATFLSPSPH
jgi:hypothetical protein